MKKHAWVVLAFVLIFTTTVSCTGSDDEAEAEERGPDIAKKVESAHPSQAKHVSALLKDGVRLVEPVYLIRSEHHKNAWWLGSKINGGVSDGRAGVWLVTGEKDDPGMSLPASSFAVEASVGNPLRETEAWGWRMVEPVTELREYVETQ